MKRLIFSLILFIVFTMSAMAQNAEWGMIHQGNRAFSRGEWAKAEKCYRKALEKNPRNSRAMFNLGDTYLAQKNGKDALQCFANAAKGEHNRMVRAMAYHNIGFIHQNNKDYDRAIDAYKEALRNNPYDDDTRYNLALCQKQRQQQQQDRQQQQDQNKENGNDKQQQEPQQQQKNEEKMSEENIEQILNLTRQAEQQTRKKMENAGHPRRKQLEKGW